MKKLRLLIGDRDADYGQALGRALSISQRNFQVTVTAAARVGNLFRKDPQQSDERDEGTEKGRGKGVAEYDLILVDQEDRRQMLRQGSLADQRILGLCDEPTEEEGLLYRFEGAEDMAARLCFQLGKLTKEAGDIACGSTVFPAIVSFYSGAGGCGQTTAALGTARELALHRDRNVLFLSLEEPDLMELYFGESLPGRGASEFIYYLLKAGENGVAAVPEVFLRSDDCGVETFPTAPGRNEFRSLRCEDLDTLLQAVCGKKRYDYLFCDLPSELSENVDYILRRSTVIVMVRRGDPISEGKNEKAKSFLIRNWKRERETEADSSTVWTEEEYDRKILELSCGKEERGFHSRFRIPWDTESVEERDGMLRINIHQALGKGVSQLADEIQRRCELDG